MNLEHGQTSKMIKLKVLLLCADWTNYLLLWLFLLLLYSKIVNVSVRFRLLPLLKINRLSLTLQTVYYNNSALDSSHTFSQNNPRFHWFESKVLCNQMLEVHRKKHCGSSSV